MTESVWEYPRPPRIESSGKRIRVKFAGEMVADTKRALRVLETSHPPVYYIAREDVRGELIASKARQTFCEFKGLASYWTLHVRNQLAPDAAWSYEQPSAGYEAIRGYLAFYVNRVDACFVDDECVEAQQSGFYGGWITSDIKGPFKGPPGSEGW